MQVDYDIDFFSLSDDDFTSWLDCVKEVVSENDLVPSREIEEDIGRYSELYYDQICERFHFHTQRLGKTLRKLRNIDVYEVSDSGAVNFFKNYDSRFAMQMDLKAIYKLDSAFAFCPDKGLGYTIHGNVSKCKENVDILTFLYKESEANPEEIVE